MTDQREKGTAQHAKELGVDIARIMKKEWASRTRFGKVLYPLWVLDSALKWWSILAFLSVGYLIAWFAKYSRQPIPRPSIPATHKDNNE